MLTDDLASHPTEARARHFLSRVGREFAPDAMLMQKWAAPEGASRLAEVHALLGSQLKPGIALSARELAVSGADLMKEAQVPKGPLIGKILAELLQVVLDDPAENERGRLLKRGAAFAEAHS
jgi:tRNA nucleotidyltransferase (CCA-adding enzyme)